MPPPLSAPGCAPRAARRTGRALYDDVVVHQQAAMPEQIPIPFPDSTPTIGRRST
ncbi:hypothetical protein QWM81_20500 [Streptomyces ficellus]|uniref:Uncharacterized protein n=1 Tax=Streptomyces ficellus TaxID=1977088 RepID=A0ABT7ZA70_9ACTN|nr:hypothetical protein [Streptomyces ficellus]MDN3296399.1 hypothetical protein [Streptomyces ficellus]